MNRRPRALRRAFTGACVAWAGAIPAAAFAAAGPARMPVYLFAVAVYAIGSVICHQLPERSFHIWGRQLPVCARCVGIYAGAALAVGAFYASQWGPRGGAARAGSVLGGDSGHLHRRRLQLVAWAAVPTAVTLIFEWTTHVTPSNAVRAAAGLTLGAAVAWLVMHELAANPEVN